MRQYSRYEQVLLYNMADFLYMELGLTPKTHYNYQLFSSPVVDTIALHNAPNSCITQLQRKEKNLSLALGAATDKLVRCTFANHVVYIEVPKKPSSMCVVYMESLAERNKLTNTTEIPLGVPTVVTGPLKLVTMGMNKDNVANVLLAGDTGSGKSMNLRSINYNVLRIDNEKTGLIVCDLKNGSNSFDSFDRPYKNMLHPVIRTCEETEALLNWVYINMIRIRTHFKRLFIVIDEFQELTNFNPNVMTKLSSILRVCRGNNIRFLLATQYPTKQNISDTGIIQHCPLRVGSRASLVNSNLVLESKDLSYLSGLGDTIYKDENGKLTRMTMPFTSDTVITQLPTRNTFNRLPLDSCKSSDANNSTQGGEQTITLTKPELYALALAKSDNDLRMNGNVGLTEPGKQITQIGASKRKEITQKAKDIRTMLHGWNKMLKRDNEPIFYNPFPGESHTHTVCPSPHTRP